TPLLSSDGVLFDSTRLHNACVVDRFHPSTPKPDHTFTHAALVGSYVVIALISLLAGFKQRINWLKSSYMVAMNLGGYCMVVFLKEFLKDTMCNQNKANSVSGHFAFFFFHIFTLPYIWRHSNWHQEVSG